MSVAASATYSLILILQQLHDKELGFGGPAVPPVKSMHRVLGRIEAAATTGVCQPARANPRRSCCFGLSPRIGLGRACEATPHVYGPLHMLWQDDRSAGSFAIGPFSRN
jgi:hypothetical protein